MEHSEKLHRRLRTATIATAIALIALFIWAAQMKIRIENEHTESVKTMKMGDSVYLMPNTNPILVIDTIIGDDAIIFTIVKKSNLHK